MKNKSSVTLLCKFLRPWKKNILLASLYSSLNKIFDIAPEVLIGVAVDLVVKKNDSFIASLGFETISSQVLFLGFITLLIWALESFFEYLYMIEWRGLAQKIEHKLRVDVYDHAQKLDLSWHEKQTTGNISAILNDDVNQLERFISINGALHYELPINKEKIKLIKLDFPLQFKEFLKTKDQNIKIFKPPFEVFWDLNNEN